MSYYDFDDHFWSPREVCVIAPQTETKERFHQLLLSTLRQLLFAKQEKIPNNETSSTHQG